MVLCISMKVVCVRVDWVRSGVSGMDTTTLLSVTMTIQTTSSADPLMFNDSVIVLHSHVFRLPVKGIVLSLLRLPCIEHEPNNKDLLDIV